jgi:hypothetical protein
LRFGLLRLYGLGDQSSVVVEEMGGEFRFMLGLPRPPRLLHATVKSATRTLPPPVGTQLPTLTPSSDTARRDRREGSFVLFLAGWLAG